MTSPFKHVHIMDPQLQGMGGHYMNHDRQLLAELQSRGVPVSLFCRKGATLADCSGVPLEPVFTLDIFKEAATDGLVWPMENFHALNTAFLADLMRVPAGRFGPSDFVYFPNILQNQIHGVAQWLSRIPEANRPVVGLMLRYMNHAMDYVATRGNKELIPLYYRYACRELLRVQPRALICADTRELAQAYEKIIGLSVLELPNPMDVSELVAGLAARPANDRPLVVYQGHTSPLRGFHFLSEIVEHAAKHPLKPRFVIQVQSPDGVDGMGLRPMYDSLRRMEGPDLVLKQGALANDEYYDLLKAADIILLPYKSSFYGYGSSGVFSEAASLGKVVVVSADTVPARQGVEHGLGVVVAKEWTPRGMADAVRQSLDGLPALRAKAAAGAGAYRNENCARTLWDRIFKASGSRA